MRKRIMMLMLAACLLLTACSGREREKKSGEETGQTEVLLTVDGREVPAWRYLCWLTHACRQVQEQYAAAGQDVDWSMPVESGTLADYVKKQALADTVLYATVENWAERYGCEVPEQDFSAGGLPLTGLSEAQERELWLVGKQYAALYALFCTEGSALAPTEEALAAFAGEHGSMLLNRILIAAGEDRESAKGQAAELFSRLNSAETPVELFASLAAEGDDPTGPRPEEACGWEEPLLAAARSLETGQYSGILESEEGFSILMRLEQDPDVVRGEYFDFLLQQAAAEAVVAVQPRYHEVEPEDVCPAGGGDLR